MYSNIKEVPKTRHYNEKDNALSYYAILHAIKVHQYEYDRIVPDCDYATYCSDFIRGLSHQLYQWLRNVDYTSYDYCHDPNSSDITWAIDCLITYEKKEELDRDLESKYTDDEDLPF